MEVTTTEEAFGRAVSFGSGRAANPTEAESVATEVATVGEIFGGAVSFGSGKWVNSMEATQ